MTTLSPEILYGPRLSPFKAPLGEKRRPCTWTLSARFQAPQVDAVEALARKKDCKPGDIIRTAVTEFLSKYSPTDPADNGQPLTAHHTPREAQINQGLVPHTEKTRRQPQSSISHLRAMQSQSTNSPDKQTPTTTNHPDKRGGMKDKIPSF
jgi:hypothetical protein